MMDFYFVRALYDQAIRDGSPNRIIKAHDKALEMVLCGEGTQLISATINGKTVSKKVFKTPDQLVKECSLALSYYQNGLEGSFSIDYTLTTGA
jgi:uncharacterized protein (UPF0262 family)